MDAQKYKLRDSIFDRTKLLIKEIWSEVSDPLCLQNSFFDNIRDGIDIYRYKNYDQMIKRSINLPESRWSYDGKLGLFINRDNESIRLAIVVPKNGHSKYIHAKIGSGKEIVAALPYELHREIVDAIEKMTEERLYDISGGHIRTSKNCFSNPTLVLYGYSIDFGKANHEEVAEMLNKYGLEAIVREE